MPRDLRRALDQELGDDASTWKASVGEQIIGRIVRRDIVPNKFKPESPTDRLVVHTDEGPHRTIYGNHAVLRSKIQTLDPQVGDRIAIRREPDDPDKNYARYKVIVERAADQATPSDPDDDVTF